jgi:CBS domain-containing protein
MKVKDLMARPPLTIRDNDDVALAVQLMAWGDVRHLPVLRDDHLVGIVSQRDILATGEANPRVSQIMSAPVQTAHPDDEVADAARRMVAGRLGCLPVLNRGELVGIVTVTDMVAAQSGLGLDVLPVSVRSIMTRSPIVASAEDSLLQAVARMAERHIRHLPVVDGARKVIGMLSDREVRLALGASLLAISDGAAPSRTQFLAVRDAMSREPAVVHESAPVSEAAASFIHRNVGALPVIDDDERLVGMLSYVDVLRTLLERWAARLAG